MKSFELFGKVYNFRFNKDGKATNHRQVVSLYQEHAYSSLLQSKICSHYTAWSVSVLDYSFASTNH